MPLIDDVKVICDRLAPLGWRNLLLRVTGNGLDISQPTSGGLLAALTAQLAAIDRHHRGFEDFHASASQAITGGSPARSLLYHALASPDVHPTPDGMPDAVPGHYPSLEELDVIENFIYSRVAARTDLAGAIVAVFAYQYRPGRRTTHLRHADFAYSRTGVARVGTAAPHYDPARRSFGSSRRTAATRSPFSRPVMASFCPSGRNRVRQGRFSANTRGRSITTSFSPFINCSPGMSAWPGRI